MEQLIKNFIERNTLSYLPLFELYQFSNGFIVKSHDVNTLHCYVDSQSKKIYEPIYVLHYVMIKGKNKTIVIHTENKRLSEINDNSLEIIFKDKLNLYKEKRKKYLTTKFKYRQKIRDNKPQHFVFNNGIDMKIVTLPNNNMEKKTLIYFLNGFKNSDSLTVDINQTLDNNFLVSLVQNFSNIFTDVRPSKIKYHRTKINFNPILKIHLLGKTFNINNELLTIIDANKIRFNTLGYESFEVFNHNTNQTENKKINLSDLDIKNIANNIEINDLHKYRILVNKTKFL